MNICLYGASSQSISREYIEKTTEFGKMLAKREHNLVYGAGANGLMGAAANGVVSGGGKIIGVSPKFFQADGVLFDGCDEMIYTDTMRERKQIMEQRSDAFVMVPGGIGTFDEFFEILTLKQLSQHTKPIAVYNISGYFDPLEKLLENAVSGGFMTENSLSLCKVSRSADEIFNYFENYRYEGLNISQYKEIGK